VIPARGKSTVQSSFIWLVKVASRDQSAGLAQTLTGASKMQPNDEKTAELCLVKRNKRKRLKLLKAFLYAIKILVPLFALIDKHWTRLVAFFE
jgi:hypothetical protein